MKKKSRKKKKNPSPKDTSRLRDSWDSMSSEERLALLSKTGRVEVCGSFFAKYTWNEIPDSFRSDLGLAFTGKLTREPPSPWKITIPDYIQKQCPYFNKDVKQNTTESHKHTIIEFPNKMSIISSDKKSDEQSPLKTEGFHINLQVEEAIIRLNDILCEFERTSGRQTLLMLIPENSDEQIIISQSGKPLPPKMLTPEEALAFTMKLRREE